MTELTEIDVSLFPAGNAILFTGWDRREMPFAARFDLPIKVEPEAFLGQAWTEVAFALTWFDWRGDKVEVARAIDPHDDRRGHA